MSRLSYPTTPTPNGLAVPNGVAVPSGLTLTPTPRPRIRRYPDRDPELVPAWIWEQMRQAAPIGPWPLVLLGDAGVGKTYAALCLADLAAQSASYITVAEACEELILVQKGTLDHGAGPLSVRGWWKRKAEVGMLILDELGARSAVSDHHFETVHRLLDYRHGRPTIVISNTNLAAIEKTYDSRIASRLAGGTVIEVGGRDRRLKGSGA